jgi:hypothetical protein
MTSRRHTPRKTPPMPPVEYGIPIPERVKDLDNRGGPPRWPWTEVEVGGSFFAAGYGPTPKHGLTVIQVRSGCAVVVGTDWMGEFRQENGVWGTRVWRIK